MKKKSKNIYEGKCGVNTSTTVTKIGTPIINGQLVLW